MRKLVSMYFFNRCFSWVERAIMAGLVLLMFTPVNLTATDSPIDLGTRRELFVDHFLIESLDVVELKLQQPQHGGVALRYSEGVLGDKGNFYTTVFKDGPIYRMYYRCYSLTDDDESDKPKKGNICYAESSDGINWVRPELGLFEIYGSKLNNVILPLGETFGPAIDTRPGIPASERYKAVMEAVGKYMAVIDPETSKFALKLDTEQINGLMGYVSADGINWLPVSEKPVLYRDYDLYNHLDASNILFWSQAEEQYVCYMRHAAGGELKDGGIRAVVRSTSKDFLHWSKPVPMTFSDTGSIRPSQHLYVNNTQPYFRAPQIYIALMGRLQQDRRVLTGEQAGAVFGDPASEAADDVGEGVFLTTRAGSTRYDFTFRETFVRPGLDIRNWTTRNNYPATGIVQTGKDEMSFYVQRNFFQKSTYLERMVLRLDGFVSVNAPYDGGELVTKPFTFSGKELEINYSTSAAGGIRVEIQDAEGQPVDGFTLDDCPEIIGDEISRIVSWEKGTDLSGLTGKPVRMRFRMHDADLFSIRFKP